MKKLGIILWISCLTSAFVGCDTIQSKEEEKPVTTNTTAPITETADTTLQPKVELTLHATGNDPEEMTFDQDTLHVPNESLIKLNLVNEGSGLTVIHNFVIVPDGMYQKVAISEQKESATGNYIPKSKEVFTATPLALPGQTIVHEFKAPPKGTYDFVCTYPDHWKTMHGKLIVK